MLDFRVTCPSTHNSISAFYDKYKEFITHLMETNSPNGGISYIYAKIISIFSLTFSQIR